MYLSICNFFWIPIFCKNWYDLSNLVIIIHVISGVKGKPPDEKEEKQFDAITPELVKSEKSFIKLTKKHQRELDTMRKKQQKERSGVQKNQCTAIEKLVKSKGRYVFIVFFVK